MFYNSKTKHGFTLVETVIVVAVVVIVFAGLFAGFRYTLNLIADSRAKLTALSLATDRLEYIRSLPYASMGTVSGIPAGNIPQNRSVMLNGITFNERVLIEYVDDPADGTAGADSNGVVADYKNIKVEYTWDIYETPSNLYVVSTVVPRSIETNDGGGTIRVNVFDANVAPLQGIDVRLVNNTTTSTIDITRNTDATGSALFTGAPAGSNYEVYVSEPGYSADQTRVSTTTLPNPSTPLVSLLESDVSTVNFQVDRVSDLDVHVFNNQVTSYYEDDFSTTTSLSVISNLQATSGKLMLEETGGVYETSGYVLLNPLTPSPLEAWGVVEVSTAVPAQTSALVRFYTSTSTSDLISDSDLPGNSAGFSTEFIDISALSAASYPTLVVGVELTTSDTSVTPEVFILTVHYVASRNYLAGVNLDIHGAKIKGTLDDLSPVYKYNLSTTTNASGLVPLREIEWDSYTVALGSGYTIKDGCPASPTAIAPNSDNELYLEAVSASANSLRVDVRDGTGLPVIGADVDLELGASSWNQDTSWCGQVYFGSLTADPNYVLTVSAPGYSTQVIDPIDISSPSLVRSIILAP